MYRFVNLLKFSSPYIAALTTFALIALVQSSRVQGDTFAFLVSVSHCADARFPVLRFSENDVERFTMLLEAGGVPTKNIVVLSEARGNRSALLQPTQKNILSQLRQLVERLGGDDEMIVVFSGHGGQYTHDTYPFYCPIDSDPRNPDSTLAFEDVLTMLLSRPIKSTTVFFDTCRNEPRRAAAIDSQGERRKHSKNQTKQKLDDIDIIFSCEAKERAFEDPKIQHSVFMHFVIEALRGDADENDDSRIATQEIRDYLRREVTGYVRRRLAKTQTPEYVGGDASRVLWKLPK